MPPVTPMPRPVVVAGAVTAQRWTAPFIADECDGTDWRELRHGIEHRLCGFTAPHDLQDWRRSKVNGLDRAFHDGGDRL